MVSSSNSGETNLERVKRLQFGHCCWHCQHYIRPIEVVMLDGPVNSICTIDRAQDMYVVYDEMMPGDKECKPEDCCDRFEMDTPPESTPGLAQAL